MARCCWPSRNLGPTTAGQFQSSNYLGQPIQLPIKAGEVHAPDPNTRFRPPRWDTPATLRDRHPERCACTGRESRSAVRRIADNRPLSPASGYSVVRRDDFDYQMRRPVFGLTLETGPVPWGRLDRTGSASGRAAARRRRNLRPLPGLHGGKSVPDRRLVPCNIRVAPGRAAREI